MTELPEAPERWRCKECRHVSETYLTAPSPFDAHDELIACEKCKEVGSLVAACWKCDRAAGIGTPFSGVYRYIQTCSTHNPEDGTPGNNGDSEMTEERCIECDEPTGRAGKADDSLYLPDGEGPFCEECYKMFTAEEHTFRP